MLARSAALALHLFEGIHVGEGLALVVRFLVAEDVDARRGAHVGDAQLAFGPLLRCAVAQPPAGGAICKLLAPFVFELGAVVPVVDPRRLAVEARVVEDAVLAAADALARDRAPDEVVVLGRVDEKVFKLPRRPDGVAQLDRLRRVAVARLEARLGAPRLRRSWSPRRPRSARPPGKSVLPQAISSATSSGKRSSAATQLGSCAKCCERSWRSDP